MRLTWSINALRRSLKLLMHLKKILEINSIKHYKLQVSSKIS